MQMILTYMVLDEILQRIFKEKENFKRFLLTENEENEEMNRGF